MLHIFTNNIFIIKFSNLLIDKNTTNIQFKIIIKLNTIKFIIKMDNWIFNYYVFSNKYNDNNNPLYSFKVKDDYLKHTTQLTYCKS